MERQVADKKIAGGIVIVSHDGKIGFFHAYGQMDLEAKKPMQPDTIFRIYSMSKAITTAAALNLVDAGKIAVDDPVSKFIPSFADLKVATKSGLRAPKRPMTVRDLMLHTAGLTYGAGPDALKEAYGRLKPLESTNLEGNGRQARPDPAGFRSRHRLDLLGLDRRPRPRDRSRQRRAARRLSHEDHLRTARHARHRLQRSARKARPIRRQLQPFDRRPEGDRRARPVAVTPSKVTFFSGGGGLVGTARDYLRFLTMIQNGGELDGHRVLRPETVALMTTNQLPKEAFPIHFDKEIRHGVGFGFGFSRSHRKHEVGPGRPCRRIWLGRSRLNPLLGQPGRQIDRDHARTDHALSMGYRVRREKNHLRRDHQMIAVVNRGHHHGSRSPM